MPTQSFTIFAAGIQDLYAGSSICSRTLLFSLSVLAVILQLFIISLSSVLVAHGQLAMLAFLVFGAVALVVHACTLALYLRHGMRSMQDQPRQQLLTSRERPAAKASTDVEVRTGFFLSRVAAVLCWVACLCLTDT